MSSLCRALYRSFPAITGRSFHASSALHDNKNLQRMQFNLKGFHKYGLLADDLEFDSDPIVLEAIRRLPEEERLLRIYRAIRATQAEIAHDILPEDQWTKFDDNHYYLQPYIKEIKEELEEMAEWEANH